MEMYYKIIKKRMIREAVLATLLIPVAILALITFYNLDSPISGSSILDFLGGTINGVRSAIVLAFVIYLLSMFVQDMKAIKDKDKLKELFVTEHDERTIHINEKASKMSFYIILYIIIVAALLTGLFNTTISLVLFGVWVFIIIVRIIITIIYSRIM